MDSALVQGERIIMLNRKFLQADNAKKILKRLQMPSLKLPITREEALVCESMNQNPRENVHG